MAKATKASNRLSLAESTGCAGSGTRIKDSKNGVWPKTITAASQEAVGETTHLLWGAINCVVSRVRDEVVFLSLGSNVRQPPHVCRRQRQLSWTRRQRLAEREQLHSLRLMWHSADGARHSPAEVNAGRAEPSNGVHSG